MKQSILLKSVANARELGGYHTADGKTVRKGALLRTANLNDITAGDIQTLNNVYRLSDIIDFRMEMELRGYEDPVIGGVTYTHLDVIDIPGLLSPEEPDVDINKLDVIQLVEMSEQIGMLNEDMYIGFLKNDMGKRAFSRFFRILLTADPDRAVLWHCTSGKDRTGLAAMLLLSALGVEEPVIMEDYMLTNEYNAPRIEETKRYLKAKGCEEAFAKKAALVFDAVDRSFMEKAIAFLKEEYGSTAGYIRSELRQHRTEIARQISSIIFCQIDKIDAGILTYFKEILAKMTENLPKDGVQSRQGVFVRCCLNISDGGIDLLKEKYTE